MFYTVFDKDILARVYVFSDVSLSIKKEKKSKGLNVSQWDDSICKCSSYF